METRSLSRSEAKVVLALEAEGVEDLTLEGLRQRVAVSPGFARKIAHDLVKKGWLQRVGRGRYLLNPSRHGPDAIPDTDPFRLGSRIVSPYYFGFSTAAELLGFLPQTSRLYYIVSPKRGSAPWIHAAQFRRITVDPGRFFGFERIDRRGESISISDPERTVIDCLSRPEFSGGLGGVVKVIESAARTLKWGRMDRYLRRLGSRSLTLRLGYLVESFGPTGLSPTRWLDRARAQPDDPYIPLGAPKEFGRRGVRDPRWHLILNVPEALLRAEVDVR
ncbi:MAG: type IV toxin-antitoxin system AbiEi family antitoxin [Thermoplasmata archaeon]